LDIEEIITAFFDAANRHHLEAMDDLFSEGVTILRLKKSKICFISDFFKETGKF